MNVIHCFPVFCAVVLNFIMLRCLFSVLRALTQPFSVFVLVSCFYSVSLLYDLVRFP